MHACRLPANYCRGAALYSLLQVEQIYFLTEMFTDDSMLENKYGIMQKIRSGSLFLVTED